MSIDYKDWLQKSRPQLEKTRLFLAVKSPQSIELIRKIDAVLGLDHLPSINADQQSLIISLKNDIKAFVKDRKAVVASRTSQQPFVDTRNTNSTNTTAIVALKPPEIKIESYQDKYNISIEMLKSFVKSNHSLNPSNIEALKDLLITVSNILKQILQAKNISKAFSKLFIIVKRLLGTINMKIQSKIDNNTYEEIQSKLFTIASVADSLKSSFYHIKA